MIEINEEKAFSYNANKCRRNDKIKKITTQQPLIIVVIESDKNFQLVLKQVGESLMRNKMCMWYLQNTYYKGKKNNFLVKNIVDITFHQVTTSSGTK